MITNVNMQRAFLLLPVLSFLLLSCTGESSSDQANTETLFVLDSVRYEFGFSTDDSIHKAGMTKTHLGFHYQDTAFIVTDNIRFNKLIIYSLTHPVIKKVVDYPSEIKYGGDKVSAFVTPGHFYTLTERGMLYQFRNNKYELLTELNKDSVLRKNGLWTKPHVSAELPEFQYLDGKLFIPVEPDFSGTGYSATITRGIPFPVTAIYDPEQKEMIIRPFLQPDELIENDFGIIGNLQQYHKNKDTTIYYAPCLPYCYVYTNKTYKRFQCRSKFQTDSIRPLNFINNAAAQEKDLMHAQQSGNYFGFVYDPYKHFYYRFFALPLPEIRTDGYYNTMLDTRVSIIVLDEQFSTIEEILCPAGLFHISVAQPTSNGLIINKPHFLRDINHGFEFYELKYKGEKQ